MKVVFLDIDGVMNSIGTAEMKHRIDKNRSNALQIGASTFHESAINNLNRLMNKIQNLWIVITSTWREYNSIQEIAKMFEMAGFEYSHRIFDGTSSKPPTRSMQILTWLRENAIVNEVNSFVIIDDNIISGLLENYSILVDSKVGLSHVDINVIINNFRIHEYRLAKVWKLVSLKNQ